MNAIPKTEKCNRKHFHSQQKSQRSIKRKEILTSNVGLSRPSMSFSISLQVIMVSLLVNCWSSRPMTGEPNPRLIPSVLRSGISCVCVPSITQHQSISNRTRKLFVELRDDETLGDVMLYTLQGHALSVPLLPWSFPCYRKNLQRLSC